ncbi:uncharacterized protein LOC115629544 [Scaptodrosophila lebanonensis]|uniref:Uncharacterized protein LOC115629544 n=1 Tax=Drosophila lebanonensis TaxID=7225 RepID=A0A6J2U0K8_DROLE|nr:uncharacterized protein LOC115629544 [Scaptodrosophila lebanonensis]
MALAATSTTTTNEPPTTMLPAVEQVQEFNWQLEDYAYFSKCGEITTSPNLQCFGFNCAFCPAICLQFDVFMAHIHSYHVQDMRLRYDCDYSDEKIEKATQTDLMIMDMHMDIDVFQIDDNVNSANSGAGAATKTTQTATPTNTTRSDKRIKKCNWNGPAMDMEMDIDRELVGIVGENDNKTKPPTATPLQLNTEPGTATATMPEIDFVYIMENPLPPSPPPSADILYDEQCTLQSIDPYEMLHDVCMVAPTHTKPHTPHTHTILEELEESMVAMPLPEAVGLGARYETRRVAMQRKLLAKENENAKTTIEQQQQQQQQQQEQHIAVGLTPPATPPTPGAPTSPTSSVASSSLGFKTRTRRELERNHDFVSALLLAYERHEKLWNPKHPEYKYNAKRSVYGELAAPLERVFEVQLTGAEIFAVLKDLRGRYRRELSKLNSQEGNYKSRLWCFEKMHFLRDVIEKKRADREAKSGSDSTESEKSCETDTDSSKSAQYREVLAFILEAFKRKECLWNPHHIGYADCPKKELYREISAQLRQELNYEMSGDVCCKEIQKLRTRYRKELRMVIKHKGLYLPKLWCYDEMEFLQRILQEQIFSKISKKVGVVETTQKTKFINANCIIFDSQQDQLQFVEIYQNYSALWDVDHPDFRSNTYRSQALAQMLEELNNTFQTSHTSAQLEKTLFQMRKEFSAQKRKILLNDGGSSTSLVHAKLSQFLDQNLGPFRCDLCEQLIKTCDQYKVHRSAHDGTQPFICTLCGKGFQMPCNLTVHIRRHRQDFPYACEQCNKRFATSTEAAIHMRTHTGERPYICDLCGKSFKTWSFFDIHRRTHLNQSTFHCPICDKGFYEKNRFTDHMNGHLNIRKHLCTVCGKKFTTFSNLKKHKELHLAVKKYKCVMCGKRFAQFASLRWHRKRVHSEEGDP